MEQLAGIEDFQVALATYRAACERWPGTAITLRQGERLIESPVRPRQETLVYPPPPDTENPKQRINGPLLAFRPLQLLRGVHHQFFSDRSCRRARIRQRIELQPVKTKYSLQSR
jgi:hypothetical protein